ncbi:MULTISPECIES: NAD(P)H-dependent flavin oxidoreductase [Streptomycetaceae]|uniref:Oxidoreductase, 2-nitropropane dioxygenase family protein n=1 Tax=Streptantibioticus cattleyicolor (strain ATCC 35852 / DSM 46488 / JCM 4925 / NBRC 14057 / NRRL 8057) TaxID=1003195 RepID=F8K422_STREN|nr:MULTISPECIES: nitronate monooxygenase [Streptomycetaceae]AEW92560.1 oxidoreductase, 2-nitropropane dioxygenase family protein [Streptantibioticus cattleyicolor NRRL 8057 = DSM 46488]MYS57346.1 nitronate monooxygenase [Streptomyces sp. SID5468]CCB72916.1 Oxidoreductase, 2-nitropropane dioxygenase family protein [Streptantibioticus cattleyicolor NRRL 8057 = DSM 46488]
MLTTRLTHALGITHPVVLAPMDGVAGARLATAVTSAGGLGLLGGGYGDGEWLKREFAAAAGTRVGCGLITWSLARRPELLDVALEHRPAAVMLSFGDPAPFADRIRAAAVPLLCQVHTLDQARQALDAGADAVVAQGGEAGGHGVGTRSTFTLVPDVADLIADRSPATLLLAAGGVADGRGLAGALALGADGVLVGTRFWATEEAVVPARAQARAMAAGGDDTVRTSVFDIVRGYDWPDDYKGRVLRNGFVDRWHGRETELTAQLAECTGQFEDAVSRQDFDVANVTVGEGVSQIHDTPPAGEVVRRMTRDAAARLGRWASPTTAVGGRDGTAPREPEVSGP